MNAHALSVLELDRVLEAVAGMAGSELGRDAVLALRPAADPVFLQAELDRVDETRRLMLEQPDWRPSVVPDARAALKRLSVDGGVLEPLDLFRVARLLEAGRSLDRALAGGGRALPLLMGIGERLLSDRDREGRIDRIVDGEGNILDSASRELARIRRELRRVRSRIVDKLESYLAGLPDRVRVDDGSVSVRQGRYVVPVRREGKSVVGGIIHGESATGQTLFVEPPLAIELMNRVGELEREEERERLRILREESEALRPHQPALAESLDALVAFDCLWARARAARKWDGTVPKLLPGDAEELAVAAGRHPLLALREDIDVVPFDLTLERGERCLVVSGPNTGGKTVFLKALGLLSLMVQSGVVPPVGPGTRLPVFEDIFADIGDEQSIAESLSTFSAHLANLKEVVEGAGARTLVLLDEMGTGTDPTEGAALARAIIEELVERGALSVVTSHLGQLKRLDEEGSGVVNASLQFDPDRMEPTYVLNKGRPGRSYGLAIARRLGFPGEVLDRAEGHISEGEASVEELLERLERKEKEARELVDSLEREHGEAERLRRELAEREAELRHAERSAERRAREEARQLLMEARGEVEAAIREVRATTDAEQVEEASHRARRRVEEAARAQRRKKPAAGGASGPAYDFQPGDRARVADTGALGLVVEVREDRATVEVSGLKIKVPVADLEPVDDDSRPRGGNGGSASQEPGSGWTAPGSDAETEVDLRGLRVHEVDVELGRALDQAVLADLPHLRIIHGRGTGALRSRVTELLRRDSRVRDFRLGRIGEGGTGVTVADLSG